MSRQHTRSGLLGRAPSLSLTRWLWPAHSIHAALVLTLGLAIGLASPAPAQTAPSAPDLTAASDVGISNGDNLTNLNSLTFTGTAPAGTTVTLFDSPCEQQWLSQRRR
jgi:hypothetical protein